MERDMPEEMQKIEICTSVKTQLYDALTILRQN